MFTCLPNPGVALARLLTDRTLAGTTGKYFEGMKEIRSSVEACDEGRAEELWQASEKLTWLRYLVLAA
ncbi:TPA: hypothetical protein ACQTZB_005050 [Pseudomonas aeruginosa]|jgi:hypothetical protein|uniref:hypothetical protein n=1 Tax=uncultured Caulobacter sp. TaxID=158749 RepID=UPI002619EE44|nr:hypothetical protein [uncultured Caulobacter sp.]